MNRLWHIRNRPSSNKEKLDRFTANLFQVSEELILPSRDLSVALSFKGLWWSSIAGTIDKVISHLSIHLNFSPCPLPGDWTWSLSPPQSCLSIFQFPASTLDLPASTLPASSHPAHQLGSSTCRDTATSGTELTTKASAWWEGMTRWSHGDPGSQRSFGSTHPFGSQLRYHEKHTNLSSTAAQWPHPIPGVPLLKVPPDFLLSLWGMRPLYWLSCREARL